jgi:hypothetical protein
MTRFQVLVTHAVFPDSWKQAQYVITPKPGKKDYSDPKAYRPISLFPCISKIYEKLMALRLATAATQCSAISPTQMSARQQYSAIDALLHILTLMSQSLSVRRTSNQHPNRPSFLAQDVDGAFNDTHPGRLLEIMRLRRFTKYLIQWTSSFTSTRSLGFCFSRQSEPPKPFLSGLPQGSPASPPSRSLPKYHLSYVDDLGDLQFSLNPNRAVQRLRERAEQLPTANF